MSIDNPFSNKTVEHYGLRTATIPTVHFSTFRSSYNDDHRSDSLEAIAAMFKDKLS